MRDPHVLLELLSGVRDSSTLRVALLKHVVRE